MNLYFCHTHISIWNILSHLRLSLSKTTTIKLYNICSSLSIVKRLNWFQHNTTAIISADNMHYFTYISQPHTNIINQPIKHTNVYNTINIWQNYTNAPMLHQYNELNHQILVDINIKTLFPIKSSFYFTHVNFINQLNNTWNYTTNILKQHQYLY